MEISSFVNKLRFTLRIELPTASYIFHSNSSRGLFSCSKWRPGKTTPSTRLLNSPQIMEYFITGTHVKCLRSGRNRGSRLQNNKYGYQWLEMTSKTTVYFCVTSQFLEYSLNIGFSERHFEERECPRYELGLSTLAGF